MWSGTCKASEACIFSFFSPNLVWNFEGGRCKAIVFYSSRSHPPPTNSIVEVGFRFWISSKTRSRSSQKSYAVSFFDLCISTWYILYPDKVWHPEDPPRPFGSLKIRGGGIFHVVRWNMSQKFLASPPPQIPGLKGVDINCIVCIPTTHNMPGKRSQNRTPCRVLFQASTLVSIAQGRKQCLQHRHQETLF